MSKLNAKLVENTPTKEIEYKLSDGKGLFLRVRPSGAKSWLFCFRLPGSRRINRMTLGSLEDISLKEARSRLTELRGMVAEGIDPRNARAASKAINSQAITMQGLFNTWIEYVKLSGEVSPVWASRHEDRWRLHLKKPLGDLFVKDVNRSHLAAALEAMTRKGTREETRKALTTLNLMLDYGLSRHSLEHNPARMLKPKDFAATASRPRDRVLNLKELRILWQALDDATALRDGIAATAIMTIVMATAIKLLILTGARRGEVAAMRWDELDLAASTWTLQSGRTKNRKAHTIYLSKIAVQLLHDLKAVSANSKFVFDTGRQAGQGHIHQDSLTSALTRLRLRKDPTPNINHTPLANIAPFTVHDLRRSAATAWGEYLKTAPHVIERMLNHQPLNKLVATYQHAVYANEQKTAWLAWGDLVEHQVAHEPCNVVQLKIAVIN